MFFKKGNSGSTDAWRYALGMLIVILSYTLGQAPLLLTMKMVINNDPSIDTSALDAFLDSADFSLVGLSSNLGFFLMITIFLFATAGLFVSVKYLHNKSFKSIVTAFDEIDWQRIVFAWSTWLVLGILVELFYYLLMPDNYLFEVRWSTWVVLFLIALLYLPIQSSLEEFVFRGYLLQAFGLGTPRKIYPVLITAVLFALPHSTNPEIAEFGLFPMYTYYIFAGIVLGVIVVMDDRLELALGVHAATNFMGACLLGYKGSVLQTDTLFTQITVYPWLMTLSFVICSALFLLACKQIYNWPSFAKLLDPINLSTEAQKV